MISYIFCSVHHKKRFLLKLLIPLHITQVAKHLRTPNFTQIPPQILTKRLNKNSGVTQHASVACRLRNVLKYTKKGSLSLLGSSLVLHTLKTFEPWHMHPRPRSMKDEGDGSNKTQSPSLVLIFNPLASILISFSVCFNASLNPSSYVLIITSPLRDLRDGTMRRLIPHVPGLNLVRESSNKFIMSENIMSWRLTETLSYSATNHPCSSSAAPTLLRTDWANRLNRVSSHRRVNL